MTFRRLLTFLRPYRVQAVATTVLAIGSQLVALVIPYLTGLSINTAEGGHDRTRLYQLSALIVACGVVSGVLLFFRRRLAGRLSLDVEYDLRNRDVLRTCSGSRGGSTTATRPAS